MSEETRPVLRAALDDVLVTSPYLRFLGVRAGDDAGAVVLVLPASERHIGDADRGSVHGGVLAAFAEAAARVHLLALGVASTVETVDLTVEFLREAAIVDTVAAVDVVRVGRRFATVRVDLRQGEVRRAVAAAQGTFRLRHENPSAAR